MTHNNATGRYRHTRLRSRDIELSLGIIFVNFVLFCQFPRLRYVDYNIENYIFIYSVKLNRFDLLCFHRAS